MTAHVEHYAGRARCPTCEAPRGQPCRFDRMPSDGRPHHPERIEIGLQLALKALRRQDAQ